MNKVLLVTSDFTPRLGGVASYYSQILKNSASFEVLTNVNGASGERIHKTNWVWLGWPKWLPLLWVVPYWKIKTGSKVLAAGEILPIGTALMLMNYCFGWHYMVFIHGLDINLASRNAWKRWLTKRILTKAESIIVNSNFTKKLVTDLKVKIQSLSVVYPAVSTSSVAEKQITDVRQKYGLYNKKIILTVARLVERKGIDDIILALSKVSNSISDALLVVVGDGPLKNYLVEKAKKLEVPALFTGSVDSCELSVWYKLCDLFILTPKINQIDVEGFGIVYLEAQTHAKPVIATRVGGVPEAVGDGGILVDSLTDLSDIIVKILTDEYYRLILAKKSYDHSQLFNNQAQSQKLTQALSGILKE